jgi:hypothetical protein
MAMLTIVRSGKWMPAILALCLAGFPVLAAPPGGGGGGNKVSVTAANPPEAFQGEELDVIVSGSGFDAGSSVSYLVTGTTDASQVEVLSVQYISSTELKTRIRPKDAALPTEYDIQVQTSSGRKGKGTTLFRVKVSSEPNPAIVYSVGSGQGGIHTLDADGNDLMRLVSAGSSDPVSLTWLADGSGVIWSQRTWRGRSEKREIKHVDTDGAEVRTLFTANGTIDPWVGELDTVDSSVGGCGVSGTTVYFIGRNLETDGYKDIFAFDIESPSSINGVVVDHSHSYIGLAVSKDGSLLATYAYVSGSHPAELTTVLQIRDLCAIGAPVLWAWTAQELGLPTDGANHRWIDTLDWSADFRLAASTSNEDVWLIEPFAAEGAPTITRLTGSGTGFGEDRIEQSVNWSPEGDVIAFVSLTSYSDAAVYTINVNNRVVRLLGGKSPRVIDWRDNWTAEP